MSKFKNAMNTFGKVVDHAIDRNQKVNNMANELIRRGHGVDMTAARKIAAILVDQADVTWKKKR